MSEYEQFNMSTPEVVPAKEEVVYDKFWLKSFKIVANKPTKAVATFVPSRDVTIQVEGQPVVIKQLKPEAELKRFVIEDLFAESEVNGDLKQALQSILTTFKTKAEEEGIL